MIQEQEDESTPVHKVKSLSLSALGKFHNIPGCEVLDQLKSNVKRDPKLWGKRPFESDTLYLAAMEVNAMVTGLYEKLRK